MKTVDKHIIQVFGGESWSGCSTFDDGWLLHSDGYDSFEKAQEIATGLCNEFPDMKYRPKTIQVVKW